MLPKNLAAGADGCDNYDGVDVELTLEQQMAFLQAKAEVELKVKQAETDNLRLQLGD